VLDVFCYHGSFALHAARRAENVEGIDASHQAIERANANAELNRLANLSFTTDNAFDDLRRRVRRQEKFDVIVLDPPAFAKSRADVTGARRGYKEINLRAMRLLREGGILVTCSCSYNLAEVDFIGVLASAARDARKAFRLVERRTQAADHPVLLGFPESHYLKCLVLSVV
jgi:23S rRNA (cytosine1962-C5)-methyltransferase